jgi:hypothetical protein
MNPSRFSNTKAEAIRALKRQLADTSYRALQADSAQHNTQPQSLAA